MNGVIKKYEYLNNLFRYIENNMSDDIDIEDLSNISYVSYDKLYRDFYSLTGHSVKEYIRKRRLSNALALIKTSDFSLTDIALGCGYSSHQTLCRAVKQTLGLTPSEYKNGDTHYFFPPFNGEALHSVIVSSETIPQTLCIRFYHSKLTNIENMAVDAFLQAVPSYKGRIFGRNGERGPNRFCYEFYLADTEIDYGKLKPYGFEIVQKTPCYTNLLATSVVRNDEQKINSAWDYLYSEWLQNSMFEYTGEPYYEEYILKNGKPVKLKLYLPIKKRSEEMKIILVNNPGLRFIVSKAKGYNAEKIASKMVIDYLTAHYPFIVNTSKELYLRKEINAFICGVKVNTDLNLVKDENIASVTTDQCNYLVLGNNVMGDYDRYAELLLSYARDNGMDADGDGVFAVYDANESFDNLKIKMYCPVKIRKK